MAAPTAAWLSAAYVKSVVANGNDIYVGGNFTSIGGIAANNIARFNLVSQRWFALGADLQANGNGVRGIVSAIAVVGNDVYVAGLFSAADNRLTQSVSANNVARWNVVTSTWAALGADAGVAKNGFDGVVNSSLVANGKLYFVGKFKNAYNNATNAVTVNNVACWNPTNSTWSSLGKGIGTQTSYEVYDVVVLGDNLFIGGKFPTVIRSDNYILHVDCIARWNLTSNSWFPLGVDSGGSGTNGCGGDVHALATDGTYIYAGGFFAHANNSATDRPPASNVARWNGTTWSTLNGNNTVGNSGVSDLVRELCFNNGQLYVGGAFENVNNPNGTTTPANYLARWNGSAWLLLGAGAIADGNGLNSEVLAATFAGGQLYVGGNFDGAFNNTGAMVTVNGLARWTGTVWTGVTNSAFKSLTSVSAASFAANSEASADSIVTAFGTTLATGTIAGRTVPLGTNLLNTTVNVLDAAGTSRPAPLYFVSALQINFLVPSGTALGVATVTVNSGDGSQSQGTLNIIACAPGMFTFNANGGGVPAAQVLRVKANNALVYESLARFDTATSRWVPNPIDLGPVGEKVFLVAYGTAIRGRGVTPATMTIGGTAASVSFAGAQGTLTGVDQVNAEIPRSLIGRGDANMIFSVGAKNANTVLINIK